MDPMTMKTALDNLMFNYGSRYGITREFFTGMLLSYTEKGMTVRGAYISIKMVITRLTGEPELFTCADIAEVTGESIDEVNERIRAAGDELKAKGIDLNEYYVLHEAIRYVTRL